MQLRNKNIMVTGGAGFIGSHLVDELIKQKPNKIIVVDNMFLGKEENLVEAKSKFNNLIIFKEDAQDYEIMKRILKNQKIDIVYNLAVIPLPASLDEPHKTTQENIEIALTFAELLRKKYYKKLIHFSSSEVYGSAKTKKIKENHELGATTPYAASKAAGDLIVMSYYKIFNLDICILRPFNNYGERQNSGSYAGIIPITMKRIMNNQDIIIYGDGKQTRDFVYVKDTVRMAINIAKNKRAIGKVINIGNSKEISILNLISTIKNITGNKRKIIHKKERLGDVKRHQADLTLAKEILNYEPKFSFEYGIKKTIEWYLQNVKENNK